MYICFAMASLIAQCTFKIVNVSQLMKNNKDSKIYSFDKGSGFVLLSEKNAMQKIKVELGKAKIAKNDPTLKFTNKIQKICRLRKK